MSRTIHARQDRLPVLSLPPVAQDVAEKLHGALVADFARMTSFRKCNPCAKLAGLDRAFVCPGNDTFSVEITGVQFVDTANAAVEASQFNGSISLVDKTWIVTVPMGTTTVGGWVVPTWLLALLAALIIAAIVWPSESWRVACVVWNFLYYWGRWLYARASGA